MTCPLSSVSATLVVETSVGVDRTCLAVLADAYREEEVKGETRVVMGFAPHIALVQAAIFPLSGKLAEPSYKIYEDIKRYFATDFDDVGSIGKRYRMHDEIGTPYCVTYDFESGNDHAVTVRNRDTMEQDRIPVDKLKDYLTEKISITR